MSMFDRLWHMTPWADAPRLADEARIEGDTAIRAVEMDTVEGDIQVAQQRDAWTTQIGRLEEIENRTREQEYLLRQLRRNVRAVDAAEARRQAPAVPPGPQPLAAIGAPAPVQGAMYRFGSFLISLGQWLPILAVVAAVFMVTGIGSAIWNGIKVGLLERRVERLTEERDAACSTAEMRGDTSRAACRQLARAHAQAVAAAEIARAQAAALTQERQVRARAAAAERRRQRAIQDVLADSPEPPAWSLRDDEPPPNQE